MKRRGFLSALIGIPAGVVASKIGCFAIAHYLKTYRSDGVLLASLSGEYHDYNDELAKIWESGGHPASYWMVPGENDTYKIEVFGSGGSGGGSKY